MFKPKFINFSLVIDVAISQVFWHSESNTGSSCLVFKNFIGLKPRQKRNDQDYFSLSSINVSLYMTDTMASSCHLSIGVCHNSEFELQTQKKEIYTAQSFSVRMRAKERKI